MGQFSKLQGLRGVFSRWSVLPLSVSNQRIRRIPEKCINRKGRFSARTTQNRNSNHKGQDDLVFCKDDGSPLNPDVLRRDVLYPTLGRLGIARNSRAAGSHTFRHSAATIVNQKTGNLKLVQKLLGHSNLSTTADVYTHTSADADRSAALALEEAIFGDLFQVVPRFGTWNTKAAPNTHSSARNFNNPGDLQKGTAEGFGCGGWI